MNTLRIALCFSLVLAQVPPVMADSPAIKLQPSSDAAHKAALKSLLDSGNDLAALQLEALRTKDKPAHDELVRRFLANRDIPFDSEHMKKYFIDDPKFQMVNPDSLDKLKRAYGLFLDDNPDALDELFDNTKEETTTTEKLDGDDIEAKRLAALKLKNKDFKPGATTIELGDGVDKTPLALAKDEAVGEEKSKIGGLVKDGLDSKLVMGGLGAAGGAAVGFMLGGPFGMMMGCLCGMMAGVAVAHIRQNSTG